MDVVGDLRLDSISLAFFIRDRSCFEVDCAFPADWQKAFSKFLSPRSRRKGGRHS